MNSPDIPLLQFPEIFRQKGMAHDGSDALGSATVGGDTGYSYSNPFPLLLTPAHILTLRGGFIGGRDFF